MSEGRKDLLTVFGLMLFAGVFLSPTLTHFSGFLDEGLVLAPAQRILRGEVVYRDFYLFYTPVGIYIYATFMKLFGSGAVSVGVCNLLVRLLGLAGLYLVGRSILKREYALVAPLIMLFSYLHNTENYINHWLANLTFIWALYLILLAHSKSDEKWSLAAGLMVAQAGMTLQTFGVLLLISGFVAFWNDKKKLLWWVGGVALGAATWFIFFAATGALTNFIQDAITSNLNRSGFEAVSFGSFLRLSWNWAKSAAPNMPVFLLITLVPAIASIAPPAVGMRETNVRVVYVSSVLMLLVCCYRLLPSQLLMHHFLSVVMIAWLCQSWGRKGLAAAGLFVLIMLPSGFKFWSDYGFAEHHIVKFPSGDVWVRRAEEAKALNQLVEFLGRKLEGEDAVLLTPYVPNLYYHMNLVPATRFVQLRSRQYTQAQMLQAIEELKQRGFPKIIHFPVYESEGFLRGSWPDEDPQLYWAQRQWFLGRLQQHYEMVDHGAIHLFQAKK